MVGMKAFLRPLWEFMKIVVVALVIVLPLRLFVFQPFLVSGSSMEPNFHHGDYLIVDELSYRLRDPQRGDTIILRYPNNPSQRFIKRIVGLPGETVAVKDGKVLVQKEGEEFVLDESVYLPSSETTPGSMSTTLKENEYFVLGDNRRFSSDSRSWGVLPAKDIVGRVFFKAISLKAFAAQ